MKFLSFLFIVIGVSSTLACLPQCRSCRCSGGCPAGDGTCTGAGSYCYCSKDDFKTLDDYMYSTLINNICSTFKNTSEPLVLYLKEIETPVELYCSDNNELKVKIHEEKIVFAQEKTCEYKGVSYSPNSCITLGNYRSMRCCPDGGWTTCASMYCENCQKNC